MLTEATPMERAELAQLTPQMRSQVEARLGSGQTVHGVLDTILLNNVSQEFASGHVVATDFQRGDVVVAEQERSAQGLPVRRRHFGGQELARPIA